ncbi:MAG: choline/ethanolamine kinase family protein [Wenzhouxiangella sp.]
MELASALATWRHWGLDLSARPRLVAPVPGGLTNRNYRLSAPGFEAGLLLRINHPDPERLGIDRRAERIILAAVAEQGIARPALYWDPAERFALFPWLEARPWTAADFASLKQRARLWPVLEQLAGLLPELPRRNYLDYLSHYWHQTDQAGLADDDLRRAWQDFEPRLRAFAAQSWPARLVHHDLVPANVLDTGQRLVLIDWEYAAVGHPEIDRWSIDPDSCREPFIAEMMNWINALWERLVRP